MKEGMWRLIFVLQKLRTGPNAHLYAHLFVPDLESAKKAFLCIAWGDHDSDYNYMSSECDLYSYSAK